MTAMGYTEKDLADMPWERLVTKFSAMQAMINYGVEFQLDIKDHQVVIARVNNETVGGQVRTVHDEWTARVVDQDEQGLSEADADRYVCWKGGLLSLDPVGPAISFPSPQAAIGAAAKALENLTTPVLVCGSTWLAWDENQKVCAKPAGHTGPHQTAKGLANTYAAKVKAKHAEFSPGFNPDDTTEGA